MNIKRLIQKLQLIAEINPSLNVCVEDGMDPSDCSPITAIKAKRDNRSGGKFVYLDCTWAYEQNLDLEEFKPDKANDHTN